MWYNHGKWPAEAVGAAYAGYLDQAVFEGMRRENVENDSVMLGRATWAGAQVSQLAIRGGLLTFSVCLDRLLVVGSVGVGRSGRATCTRTGQSCRSSSPRV